jgi:hypothetical protein
MQYITIYIILPQLTNQYCVPGISFNNCILHVWESESIVKEARPTAGFQEEYEHFSLSKFLLQLELMTD